MNFKNKKAISEVTSFILITLIIVVSSTFAYIFAKNLIDDNISELDLKNMNIYLKKLYYSLNEISSFEGSSSSFQISFKTGELRFVDNYIVYQSLKNYAGTDFCLNLICTENAVGFERIKVNLTTPYYFSNNLTLSPGSYTLFFKNIKNESKISVIYK